MTDDRPEYDWAKLVPSFINPIKVAIIEAMIWIGHPLSARDLSYIFESEGLSLARLAYHIGKLREAELLVKVSQRQVRGAIEKFYVLR